MTRARFAIAGTSIIQMISNTRTTMVRMSLAILLERIKPIRKKPPFSKKRLTKNKITAAMNNPTAAIAMLLSYLHIAVFVMLI